MELGSVSKCRETISECGVSAKTVLFLHLDVFPHLETVPGELGPLLVFKIVSKCEFVTILF